MPPKAGAAAEKPKKTKKTDTAVEDDANKVVQPDRAEHEAEVAKVNEVIEGLQKNKAALAQKISERTGGKEEFFSQKLELKSKLDELTKKIDELMGRKQGFNSNITEAKKERVEMGNALTKMKKTIGFKSEQEIDERIASIEFTMSTDTMSLKAEKDLLKEISELKKNRPKVSKVNEMQDKLDNRDTGSNARENIANIQAEINVYRDAKKGVQEQYTTLMEARKAQMGDFEGVIGDMNGISTKIQEQVKQRNELRDQFREKEREFNAWRAEQRAKKSEEFAERRKAQQDEYTQKRRLDKVEALDNQPYIEQMTLIEQTITWCKGLMGVKEEKAQVDKKETEHNLSDGKAKLEVVVKKEDRDEEFYYAPTKAKKTKKVKGKASEGTSKPIKHNAASFKFFDDLKLSAPITTDEIPDTLEKLEMQLEEYKNKVSEWEQTREERKRRIMEGNDEEDKEKKEE